MSFGTALVVIFAIACGTWVRIHRYGARGDRFGRRPDYDHTARERELEREIEEMRKRIAVLERIATEERRGSDLAREIESLRD